MLEPAGHALICKSSAKPELNKRFVICKKKLEDRGSWKVVFPGGEHEPLAVKPGNLQALPRHSFVLHETSGPLAHIPMPMMCTFDRCGRTIFVPVLFDARRAPDEPICLLNLDSCVVAFALASFAWQIW